MSTMNVIIFGLYYYDSRSNNSSHFGIHCPVLLGLD